MKLYTIIWDFDGTILPSDPYDSEQTLLLYKVNGAGEKILNKHPRQRFYELMKYFFLFRVKPVA